MTRDIEVSAVLPETIVDRAFYVVESEAANKSEQLYFDTQSRLLQMIRAVTRTALGNMVIETEFGDYRETNGVKLPHSVVVGYMEDRFVYTFSEIQTNIRLDPATFEPPK